MPKVGQEILDAALAGLEAQKTILDRHIEEVRSLLGQRGPGRPKKTASASAEAPIAKKRTLSAKARKKIVAAQKKRWAAFRKNKAKA